MKKSASANPDAAIEAALVLNKAFDVAADGWFHTVPMGEFQGLLRKADGTRQPVTQVCDKTAMENIVLNFRQDAAGERFSGLLVDREHAADSGRMDSDTRAAAWIKDVEIRADGIWCKFELTELGGGLINGGIYRFQSPTLDVQDIGGGRVRPFRIAKSTLTNTPNFRGLRPLANKETTAPGAAGQQKETDMDLKAMLLKLLAAMGQQVPADASDEAIGEMCEKCAADYTANKAAMAAAEKAKADAAKGAEADAVIAANEGKIANKAEFRALFIANPEVAKQLMGTITAGTTLNKGEAPVPQIPTDNKAERDAYVAEVSRKYGLTGSAAVSRAQELNPSLWK